MILIVKTHVFQLAVCCDSFAVLYRFPYVYISTYLPCVYIAQELTTLPQCFDTVGWVIRPVKNRRPYNLYCVGADVKPCSNNCTRMSIKKAYDHAASPNGSPKTVFLAM